MTIEDYRIEFGWSKSKLCKEADIEMNTLQRAIDGNPIFRATAGKIVPANRIALGLNKVATNSVRRPIACCAEVGGKTAVRHIRIARYAIKMLLAIRTSVGSQVSECAACERKCPQTVIETT